MTSGRNTRRAAPSVGKRRSTRRGFTRPAPVIDRAPKVGDAVEIWWSVDRRFYRGKLAICHYESNFRIEYDDGEEEDVNLTNEYWRFAPNLPDDTKDKDGDVTPPHDEDPILDTKPGPEVVEVVLDGSDAPGPVEALPDSKGSKPKNKKKDKVKEASISMPGSNPVSKNPEFNATAGAPSSNPAVVSNTFEEILEEGGVNMDTSMHGKMITAPAVDTRRNETSQESHPVGSEAVGAISASQKAGSSKARPKQKVSTKPRKVSTAKETSSTPKPVKKSSNSTDNASGQLPRKIFGSLPNYTLPRRLAKPGQLVREPVTSNVLEEGTKGAQIATEIQGRHVSGNESVSSPKYAPSRRLGKPRELLRETVPSNASAEGTKDHPALKPIQELHKVVGQGENGDNGRGNTRVASGSDGNESDDSDDIPLATKRTSISFQEEGSALKAGAAAEGQQGLAALSFSPSKQNTSRNVVRKTMPVSNSVTPKQHRVRTAKANKAKTRPENSAQTEPHVGENKNTSSKSTVKGSSAIQNPSSTEEVATNEGKVHGDHRIEQSDAKVSSPVRKGTPMKSHAKLRAEQVVSVSSDATDGTKNRNMRREDSVRSRSSSEKANVSFVAKRKKKKRQSMENGRQLGVQLSAAKGPTDSGEKVSSMGSAQGPIVGRLEASNDMVGAKKGGATRQGSLKMSVNDQIEAPDVRASLGGAVEIPRGIAPSSLHNSRGQEPVIPSDTILAGANPLERNAVDQAIRSETCADQEMPAPQGRKRARGENGRFESEGVQNGIESVTKRMRQSPSQNTQSQGQADKSNYVTSAQLTAAISNLRDQVADMISPVQDKAESAAEDVRRVMSILLSLKQQLEFYKDVVYRGVVDEGRSVRTGLKDFGTEFLQAIEVRLRQTELHVDQTLRSLLPESHITTDIRRGRDEQRNRHAPRPGPPVVPRVVPQTIERSRQVSNRKGLARVVRNVSAEAQGHVNTQERVSEPRRRPPVNGRDESPTAIVNVDQGSRKSNRSDPTPVTADLPKENVDGAMSGAAKRTRVTHLVARQVTVWLLETPHEYNPVLGSVDTWAKETAIRTFAKVQEQLLRFTSYLQAYQTLCSSLGNDAVELQWFVSPGVAEHLSRARKNYSAWDPPPNDYEWKGEVVLLRELAERFGHALEGFDLDGVTELQACVRIAKVAARNIEERFKARSAGNRRLGMGSDFPMSSGDVQLQENGPRRSTMSVPYRSNRG